MIVHEVNSFSKKPIFQLGNFEKAFIKWEKKFYEIVIDTVLYEQKTKHKQNHKLESSKVFLKVLIPTYTPKTLGGQCVI